jgi:hypothetical protein
MNLTKVESKQDLFRVLNQNKVIFSEGFEVVNEADFKSITDRARVLLRQNKKLHIVILERP